MEQNKDQSGAVRALPSDLTEREEIDLLYQVETYMSVTDKHSQTHPEAEAEEARIYSLVNGLIAKRFSDIGAAVRGEAVAETDLTTIKCPSCNGHGLIGGHSGQTPESYEEHAEVCDDCYGQGKIIVSKSDLAAFVSARAADALDSQPTDFTVKDIRASAFDEALYIVKEMRKFFAENNRLELASAVDQIFGRIQFVKSASSQPTDGGVRNG